MAEESGGEPLRLSRAAVSRTSGAAREAPLVPAGLPVLPRLRLSACRRPAARDIQADGDWLDVLILPGGSTALVMGHAGGPGGQAAAAARLRAALRELLRGGAAPAEALARLNAAAGGSPDVRGATACLAVLDPATGELSYACAGQPAPVIVVTAGEDGHLAWAASELPVPGAGRPERGTIVLPAGAVLLLSLGPAGLAEGESPAAGARRVAGAASPLLCGAGGADAGGPGLSRAGGAAAGGRTGGGRTGGGHTGEGRPGGGRPGGGRPGGGRAAAADLADRAGAAVLAGLLGGEADGDGSAMVLAAHRLAAPVAGWSMDLPADPLALRGLRVRLRDWLAELGTAASDRTDVELAVWEAAVNAVVHGRPETGPATVAVRAALDDTGRAVIQVADRGRWRPPGAPDPGRAWPGGQGLSVIRQATDELDIDSGPGGTTVTMRRGLSRPVLSRPVQGQGHGHPGEYPATAGHHGRPG